MGCVVYLKRKSSAARVVSYGSEREYRYSSKRSLLRVIFRRKKIYIRHTTGTGVCPYLGVVLLDDKFVGGFEQRDQGKYAVAVSEVVLTSPI